MGPAEYLESDHGDACHGKRGDCREKRRGQTKYGHVSAWHLARRVETTRSRCHRVAVELSRAISRAPDRSGSPAHQTRPKMTWDAGSRCVHPNKTRNAPIGANRISRQPNTPGWRQPP